MWMTNLDMLTFFLTAAASVVVPVASLKWLGKYAWLLDGRDPSPNQCPLTQVIQHVLGPMTHDLT